VWWYNTIAVVPASSDEAHGAVRQGTLSGCFVELRRAPAGRQWLYDSGRQPDLPDCTQRHSCGPARSRCTGGNSARCIYGGTFRHAVRDSHRLPTAAQSSGKSDSEPCTQACQARTKSTWMNNFHLTSPEKTAPSVIEASPQIRGLKPIRQAGQKQPGQLRVFLYSKPPLGNLTKVRSPSKAKPRRVPRRARLINRGFAAVYFGANSVASALNLPQERDLPKNHPHSNPHPSNPTPKPDISTWR
jgi:hypothetical protein